MTARLAAVALAAAFLSASARAQAATPTAEEVKASQAITPALLRAHVKFLASDLAEGRGPGTRGDALARAYIAAQLEALGLEPGAPEGGWFQKVPLVGVASHVVERPRFEGAGGAAELGPDQAVAVVGPPREGVRLAGAEVIFVGYGIVAPEFGWDDYAGADVRGRVVLVMNDDPNDDPAMFGGKARTYYGRWDYKYEEAARHGAAAAIIIHTTPSASYPFSVVQTSFAGTQYQLPDEPDPKVDVKMWATEDASRRIASLGGQDLDALRRAAQRRGFRAVPLGVRCSLALSAELSRVETANVIGRLPGRDPSRRAEVVLLTAHHDHLGTKPSAAKGGDAIFHGAVDNASGVAGVLAAARAAAALPRAAARTLVFALVAAEEQDLLGSKWLARHPPVPVGKIAVDVNLDSMNVRGRTRDVCLIGLGRSSVDDVLAPLARWQGRVVTGDPFPEKGTFYRSDQFSFAKVGVPAAYLGKAVDYVGRPPGWGREEDAAWTAKHYHQPSDEYRDDWDLSGMVEDARLVFFLASKIAEAREMPRWRKGDEFEAARLRALGGAAGGAH